MTFTLLAIAFLCVCAAVGLGRQGRANSFVTASLAAAMACAQLALLLTR